MSAASNSENDHSLLDLFNQGYSVYKKVLDTDFATSSKEYQDLLREGIEALESCTKLVNSLSLFSHNEHIDELPTSSIRYLLLPCLLGYLTSKVVSGDRTGRLQSVQCAQVYHTDYLMRCNEYSVRQQSGQSSDSSERSDIEIPRDPTSNDTSSSSSTLTPAAQLQQLCLSREKKISDYRRTQDRERRLGVYEGIISAQGEEGMQEDRLRSYYLLLLEHWIHKATDELNAIYMEKQFLQLPPPAASGPVTGSGDSKVGGGDGGVRERPRQRLLPVVITSSAAAGAGLSAGVDARRSALYRSVFGMGYPSLPTVSVEECIEQEIQEGKISLPQVPADQGSRCGGSESAGSAGAAAAGKEDGDDAAALEEARQWDDWKDDHRRGYGNTMNKG